MMSASRARAALAVVLAVVLVCVPLAGVWVMVHAASAHVVPDSASAGLATVPITTRSIDFSTTANVDVAQSVPTSIAPTSQAGTVTAVKVGPGDAVLTGAPLFAIDGVMRVAYVPHSGAALYRNLCKGDSGADVRVLQELLAVQNLYSGAVDGDFGAATEAAVKHFNARIGGDRHDGCFHVETAIPVPPDGPMVASIDLVLGATTSVTMDWVSWAAQVLSVDISVDSTAPIPDGTYTLLIDGRSFAVQVTAGHAAAVAPQDFEGLQEAEGSGTLSGTLTADEPLVVQVVPSAAIAVASDGSLCLRLARTGDAVSYVRVAPLPVGFGDQVALVPVASLEGKDAVLSAGDDALVATCR